MRIPRIGKAGVLFALCLLLFLVPAVSAVNTGFEFDKYLYRPGDTGCLLIHIISDNSEIIDIPEATLNITGIGTFVWDPSTTNASDLHSASLTNMPIFAPNGTYLRDVIGCHIEKGGSAILRIYFKIPENASKGEYSYSAYVPPIINSPATMPGGVRVYPVGEEPEQPLLDRITDIMAQVSMILILPLLLAFLILRWKRRRRAATWTKIAIVLCLAAFAVSVLPIIASALIISFTLFPFWPIIAIIAVVAVLWRRRRRKRKGKGTGKGKGKKSEQNAKASTNVT